MFEITKQQNKDMDECAESCGEKECVECSASICLMDIEAELTQLRAEVERLKPLAEIGRYTEMAFEEIMPDFTIGLDTESRNFTTVNELIAWGKLQEVKND